MTEYWIIEKQGSDFVTWACPFTIEATDFTLLWWPTQEGAAKFPTETLARTVIEAMPPHLKLHGKVAAKKITVEDV